MEERKEMVGDKAGSFRATVAIINANISSRGRCKNLTLIFQWRIGLNHCNGIVTRGMWLQVHVPQQPIGSTSATKTALPRPATRPQHLSPHVPLPNLWFSIWQKEKEKSPSSTVEFMRRSQVFAVVVGFLWGVLVSQPGPRPGRLLLNIIVPNCSPS